jgi:hypothetical protein
MNPNINNEAAAPEDNFKTNIPKHKQLIQMLSFRVVPAYYKEIEKVAKIKNVSTSKLIRSYIKDGMKRDKELSSSEEKGFDNTNMF